MFDWWASIWYQLRTGTFCYLTFEGFGGVKKLNSKLRLSGLDCNQLIKKRCHVFVNLRLKVWRITSFKFFKLAGRAIYSFESTFFSFYFCCCCSFSFWRKNAEEFLTSIFQCMKFFIDTWYYSFGTILYTVYIMLYLFSSLYLLKFSSAGLIAYYLLFWLDVLWWLFIIHERENSVTLNV